MKIFIAGATGVLGRRVVQGLIEKGHEVTGLSRSKTNQQWLEKNGAKAVSGDLFDAASMLECTAGSDMILHLATAIPSSLRTTHADWEINDRIRREGTQNLVAAALKHQCKLYLQEGLSALYGDRKGDWVDENSRFAKDQPYFLESAIEMEKFLKDAVTKKNLPAIILRFGGFYGAECAHTQKMLHLTRKGTLSKIGGGEAYWNLIHVGDAAAAVISAVEKYETQRGEIFNICDGSPVTFSDMVDFIAEEMDAKKPGNAPAFLAKPFLGKDTVDYFMMSMRCKNDKARERLDFAPHYADYRAGYRAVIQEWRKKNK